MLIEGDVQIKEVSRTKAGKARATGPSEWDFETGVSTSLILSEDSMLRQGIRFSAYSSGELLLGRAKPSREEAGCQGPFRALQ